MPNTKVFSFIYNQTKLTPRMTITMHGGKEKKRKENDVWGWSKELILVLIQK